MMGARPLAFVELYGVSKADVANRKSELLAVVRNAPFIAMEEGGGVNSFGAYPSNVEPSLSADKDSVEGLRMRGIKLKAVFLQFGEKIFCERLVFFGVSPLYRECDDEWDAGKKISKDLVNSGLCHSAYLNEECVTTGFFRKISSPAIFSSADFFALSYFLKIGKIKLEDIGNIFPELKSDSIKNIFCESQWVAKSKDFLSDDRFCPYFNR